VGSLCRAWADTSPYESSMKLPHRYVWKRAGETGWPPWGLLGVSLLDPLVFWTVGCLEKLQESTGTPA
jgi:hypothetical protein